MRFLGPAISCLGRHTQARGARCMYLRLIYQCGFERCLSGHSAGLRLRMLRRCCGNVFGLASNRANGVQYFAYRMARAKQFVVKLDLVVLVVILHALFKDVMEVRRNIGFYWHGEKSPFEKIFSHDEHRAARRLAPAARPAPEVEALAAFHCWADAR